MNNLPGDLPTGSWANPSLFSLRVLPERYFPARAHEAVRGTLTQAMATQGGLVVLIGGAGTGKSMMVRRLARDWRTTFEVVLLDAMHCRSRKAFLQYWLASMRAPYRGRDDAELWLQVLATLKATEPSQGKGWILIVDEAQRLPWELLDDLRLLLDVGEGAASPLQLVLVGGPSLDETLADPRLESFNQRVSARCYLSALARDEVGPYLAHQLGALHRPVESVLTPGAIEAVADLTGGNFRAINQLAHYLLVQTSPGLSTETPFSETEVRAAWSTLHQLPLENAADLAGDTTQSCIEIGFLDDDDAEELSETIADGETDRSGPYSVAPSPPGGEDDERADDEGAFLRIDPPSPPAPGHDGQEFRREHAIGAQRLRVVADAEEAAEPNDTAASPSPIAPSDGWNDPVVERYEPSLPDPAAEQGDSEAAAGWTTIHVMHGAFFEPARLAHPKRRSSQP